MTPRGSIRLLQIVLGVVLCFYGSQLAIVEARGSLKGHAIVLLAIGAAEAIAALVFLFAAGVGGRALLLVIALAAVIHILHAEYSGLGMLAIYASSVTVVVTNLRG